MRSDRFHSENLKKTLRKIIRYVTKKDKTLPFHEDNYGKSISPGKTKEKSLKQMEDDSRIQPRNRVITV